jgi:hypothetical protein
VPVVCVSGTKTTMTRPPCVGLMAPSVTSTCAYVAPVVELSTCGAVRLEVFWPPLASEFRSAAAKPLLHEPALRTTVATAYSLG